MSSFSKLKKRILDPPQQKNVRFDDLCWFLERSGFQCRQKGSSHKVFTKDGIAEIINLQSGQDGKAKRYQVQQVADIVLEYNL
jgi:predicted RNA binding protein YcfA (HicA-like mRNA interferase family)